MILVVTPSLELCDGRQIADPDDEVISESIRQLSADRWFLILAFTDEQYLQVGYGEPAGEKGDRYALEYRDGHGERHWRAVTGDAAEVERAFHDYRTGAMGWAERLSWEKVTF